MVLNAAVFSSLIHTSSYFVHSLYYREVDFAALNNSSRYFVHTLHYYIEFHYTERVEVDKGHKHQAVVLGAELAAIPYLEQGQTQKQCGRYRSPLTGYPVRHRMKH